jgi:protein-tyrosine kinase
MEEHGWRTLAIVSPVPECGKTVVAINLAISIAHHTNKTAMLVDFDLRKPKIAEYLGLPDGPSLNEVLEGNADASEAFVNPGMPKLVVMPVARPIRKSAEMLASAKVKQLIRDLRERYKERIVIFDLPPLLNVDDAISVLPQYRLCLDGGGQRHGDKARHGRKPSSSAFDPLAGGNSQQSRSQQRNQYY